MCIFNCTVKQLYSFSVADMEIQYNSFFCDNSMTWHNMEQRAAFPVRRQLNYNRVTSQEEPLMQQQEQILHGGTFFVPCSEQELLFSLTLNMCLKKKNTDIFSDSKVLLGTVLIKKARKP